ncbi:PREDICTED: acyl-lipid (8-3)-desaturase-like [Amphimedon queenslandica]|uniref:Cytochrome b5 heme-binding domain-containing protein n=1 Tax=Amphimedon queenslandica TaxID=400682 RepID=A0A1X7UPI3_AMPQE|nr:PREDICTED: acyl-lipid (8-3)-desaturase-like [Amphimedon queenslandica]|eukprot:XP_011404460.2 PREDICTED: acyl-lipid (8-3)-desaturase-like [Amphimedon queenslandica]
MASQENQEMQSNKRQFTWKELSQLNKRHNAHVAYKGKVYDVSSFVPNHPGGVDQIMMASSHDITNIFELYHKPETVNHILEKYYVGDLIDNEMPVYSNEDSDFFLTLQKRVRDYMKSQKLDPKFDPRMFFVYFIFTFLIWTCWYIMMRLSSFLLLSSVFAIGWGVSSGVSALTLGHDSSHYAITHKPWVWKALKFVTGLNIGFCLYTWSYQHIYGHHKFTNVEGSDPDIVTTKNVHSIWRIKKQQPWISRYLYQHIYMPFVFSLLTIKIKLQDFHTMYILKKGPVRMNPPTPMIWAEFFFVKTFHVFMLYYVPLYYMTWSRMLLLNLIYELSFGFYLAFLTQITHVNTKVIWPDPDEAKKVYTHKTWAELQVLTTTDYATDGWLWTIMSGSLNHQIAHHLFPGVIQSHYRHITPIVRQTCKDFGIQYNYEEGLSGTVYSHFKYLLNMGRGVETMEE